MLFYKRIVPLNKDKHRSLRLGEAGGVAEFAAETHYVPLAASEFHQACRHYPVLFAGGDDGGPISLLGLREEENLFVSEDGSWAEGKYVPAFVRRYPFVLAQGDEHAGFTVCFDEEYGGFNDREGHALFTEEGEHAPFLERVIQFLQTYRSEMLATDRFVETLNSLDLLVDQDLRVQTPDGASFSLKGFRVVDEERLRKLADGKVGELVREGYMGWIYAHLISLNNLSDLPRWIPENASREAPRPSGHQATTDTEPAQS